MLASKQQDSSAFHAQSNAGKFDHQANSLIPEFGVAIFDDPREMSSGWACLSGGEPFKFNSASELSNDTMWVTSLDFTEYSLRAKNQSHLRRIDYLRCSLSAIAADLGYRITGSFAMEASSVLARVVKQSMLIAIHSYGWESPTNDLKSDVLSDDIRRVLTYAPKPENHIRAALSSAMQSYSSPGWAPMFIDDSITLTLRYNRMDYAKQILATPLPDNSWSFMGPQDAGDMSLKELLDPRRPTLVEAAVELGDMDPDIATLIAFGAQPSRRAGLRKWISQPELAWLTKYAKVRVQSVLIAREAIALPNRADLPEKLASDPLFSLSVSAGLIAESHWSALANPTYNKILKTSEVNAWNTWLRAADRAKSFELALKAQEAGFRVTGYGNGSIVIRLARSSLVDCLSFAEKNGICHPSFDQLFKEHGVNYDQ
jgi:hypothetical protein